jgi:hypothetical protein
MACKLELKLRFNLVVDFCQCECTDGGEKDEETGKLYHFNKYLKGQTQTLKQRSKVQRARTASPSHLL